MGPAAILDAAARLRRDLPEDFGDDVVAGIYADADRIARRSSPAGSPGRTARQPTGRTGTPARGRGSTSAWTGCSPTGSGASSRWGCCSTRSSGSPSPAPRCPPTCSTRCSSTGATGGCARASSRPARPWWLTGVLVDGAYLGTAWVVAVMLPPMAIFFPLFTLLEDFGYLPRVAFNLDRVFARAGAHGKQSLTMMMGFGCNAAGVTATRIIDSPRERLIAILTNNFSVCNGRWPTLILMGTIFVGAAAPPAVAGLVAAGSVVAVAVLGIGVTLVVSWALSRTVLRGEVSLYSLELPPYRPPQLWRTVWRSLVERTFLVLRRALVMAAPAGVVIWLLGNVTIGGDSVAAHLVDGLGPVGWVLGLNGVILLAYLVAVPANEIVIPTVLMLTLTLDPALAAGAAPGVMLDLPDTQAGTVLVEVGGWTLLTAVNLMLFSLLHNPCSTTVLTIWRETGSLRWTTVATLMPLALACAVTASTAAVWRALG